MPSPAEHLTTAEELARKALRHAEAESWREAVIYTKMSSLFLKISATRQQVIADNIDPPLKSAIELPEWCGNCDGPELGMRFITVERADSRDGTAIARCPTCHPSGHRTTTEPAGVDHSVSHQESVVTSA
ncbi:hypothetical protein ACH4TQ_49220 [Streptomyces sp. NPDC021218]|uniref:hypothetical protein n=1 Tax=unclassified Streptomyces TaxID=2593676 RepID=UPI0036C363EA